MSLHCAKSCNIYLQIDLLSRMHAFFLWRKIYALKLSNQAKDMGRRYSCTSRSLIFLFGFAFLFGYQLFFNSRKTLIDRNEHLISNSIEIPSIFQSRWNERLFHLVRRFSHINLQVLHAIQSTANQTLTYSCVKNCGGWGDRLRGMTSTYILSVCLRRRFLIDMPSPFELSYFLSPNFIDWRITTRPIHPVQINAMYGQQADLFHRNLSTGNLTAIWSNDDHVFLTTNGDYITPLLKNRFFRSIISEIGIRSNESTQQDLFPFIFELLFKPTSLIANRLNTLLRHTSQQPILCMHIRLGQNPTIPNDAKLPYRQSLVSDMIEFIDRNLTDFRSSIFVTSDSMGSLEILRNHYGSRHVLTVDGPIIHIDRPNRKAESMKTILRGFFKVITDFYFLGECDILLMPRSGFSHWANLRRIHPYSNLYFYCRGLHRITHSNWRRPHTVC